jgi:hypothetical protein
MAYNNISQVVSAEDKQKAIAGIDLLKGLLSFLVNLTPEERQSLRKMGILRTGYVTEVFNAVMANPKTMSATFSIPEFEKDVNLIKILMEIFSSLKPFYDGLENTVIALGAECMKQADEAYAHLKLEGQRSQSQALNSTLSRIEMHKKTSKKGTKKSIKKDTDSGTIAA